MKKNLFLDGIKFGGGILFIFSIIGIVYAVGFHIAEEILPGTFTGDYEFNGSVNFTSANVSGLKSNLLEGWPDVIHCSTSTTSRWMYLRDSYSGDVYYSLIFDAGSYQIYYDNVTKEYAGQTNMGTFDCVTSSYNISTLYSLGKAYDIVLRN